MTSSTKMEPSLYYARMITEGHIPACEALTSQCARMMEDFEVQDDKDFPYTFSTQKADRIELFLSKLIMYEGKFSGRGFTPVLWQRWYVRSLFGWLEKDTGYRRYRKTFLTTSKGSGKKLLSSGLMLYLLLADREPSPQLFVVASTLDQARVIFSDAQKLTETSPFLRGRVQTWGGAVTPKYLVTPKYGSATVVSTESRAPSGPITQTCLLYTSPSPRD